MSNVEELLSKGKQLLEEDKLENALEIFEQALKLDPKNPDLWNLKGIALRSLGRYIEAVKCYEKSLEIDPRDKNAS